MHISRKWLIAACCIALLILGAGGWAWHVSRKAEVTWVTSNEDMKRLLGPEGAPPSSRGSTIEPQPRQEAVQGSKGKVTESEKASVGIGHAGPGVSSAKDGSEGGGKNTASPAKGAIKAVGSGERADKKIDLNRASVSELDALPGIGASKAKAIVEYRDKNGPFRKKEDLQKVKGIGPKLFANVADLIIVADSE